MAEDHDDAAIVNSTIALAHALRMKVVAEGVEDRTTWELLDQFGCDLVQGYFVSRPVPAEELARWLSRRPRGVSDLEPASAPRAAGGTSQLSRDFLPNP